MKKIIRIQNVRKIYKMGVERIHALDGVDLEVETNEFVAVMGASGSGKSTLMNIVGCLDRPTSGRYELDGQLVSRMSGGALARVRNQRIGFVFQSFELMARQSALKNVELPMIYSNVGWWARRKRARAVLERVGLAGRMSHRPSQLSGGQKQRVAIARALIMNPAILLADEPTGNLDSHTSREILDLFQQLHDEGQTIIIVTHEEFVAAHATRCIQMSDGKIVSDVPRQEYDRQREATRRYDHRGAAPADLSQEHSERSDGPKDTPAPPPPMRVRPAIMETRSRAEALIRQAGVCREASA